MTTASNPTIRPNPSRIYDYLLGGTHNFEADRQAGDRVDDTMPQAVHGMKLNRAFYLDHAIPQLAQAGFTCYIDLATGLPTQGYLHEHVAPTTRIVYNDHDPETVAYAREIIGDQPNIRYVQAKIETIDTILTAAEDFFGSERRVGICFVGVAYFIAPEALAHVFQRLYDWAAPGSLLAVTSFDFGLDLPEIQEIQTMYAQMGAPLYPYSMQRLLELAGPWREHGVGLLPIEDHLEAAAHGRLVAGPLRGRMGYGGVLAR